MPIHPIPAADLEKHGYNVNGYYENGLYVNDISRFNKPPIYGERDHVSWVKNIKIMKKSGKPMVDGVDKVYRLKFEEKEYVIVYYVVAGESWSGKTVDASWSQKGKYEMVVTWKKIKSDDEDSPPVETDEPSKKIWIYEYPFKGKKTKIENWKGEMVPLTSLLTPGTMFYILRGDVASTKPLACNERSLGPDFIEKWFATPRDKLLATLDVPAGGKALAELAELLKNHPTMMQGV